LQKKILIGLALTLIIVIFIPIYWATEPARQEAARERQQAEAAERGAELYTSSCAVCHGSGGEGKIGPALKGTQLDEGALEKIIARGVPGTGMLAWSDEDGGPFKGHQIDDMVTFIQNWDSALVTATEGEAGAATFTPQPPPLPITTTLTEPGQAIFEQKCKSCHSIGGGRIVGPDLKGVTERRERDWLIRFIVSPDELIAQGDPIAKQLVEEYGIPMPNMGLSEPEAEEVLAYIEAQSGGEPISPPPEQDTEKPAPLPIGDAGKGRDIYTGKIPLKHGGAACLSCHNISGVGALGGGSMGNDLTKAYSALGEQGIASILKTPPFPIMKEIYAEQPLTEDEIAHLVAFLQEVSGGGEPTPAQSPRIFIIIGVVGFLIIAGVFQFLWRRRLSGVRQPMVKGGSK
jgi:mono/diheme cytochrome c family protein